jgi:hypothetical protein
LLRSSVACCMTLLLLVPHRHHRAHLHQIHQRQQSTGGKFRLLTENNACRLGLQHPQGDLQGLAIGMLYGYRTGCLAWPGDHVETTFMERMKRIMNRHCRRHGIQCGCRSTYTFTCCFWTGCTTPTDPRHGSGKSRPPAVSS